MRLRAFRHADNIKQGPGARKKNRGQGLGVGGQEEKEKVGQKEKV